jgi:hypothetical protein
MHPCIASIRVVSHFCNAIRCLPRLVRTQNASCAITIEVIAAARRKIVHLYGTFLEDFEPVSVLGYAAEHESVFFRVKFSFEMISRSSG